MPACIKCFTKRANVLSDKCTEHTSTDELPTFFAIEWGKGSVPLLGKLAGTVAVFHTEAERDEWVGCLRDETNKDNSGVGVRQIIPSLTLDTNQYLNEKAKKLAKDHDLDAVINKWIDIFNQMHDSQIKYTEKNINEVF